MEDVRNYLPTKYSLDNTNKSVFSDHGF